MEVASSAPTKTNANAPEEHDDAIKSGGGTGKSGLGGSHWLTVWGCNFPNPSWMINSVLCGSILS